MADIDEKKNQSDGAEEQQEPFNLTEDETIVLKETQSLPVTDGQDDSDFKYEIVRELGKGGFAWVYLARNLQLDRLEAIKILSSKVIEDQEIIDRFVKEARISANFNHQHIVTIYEVEKNGSWLRFKAPAEIRRRHQEPFVTFSMSFVEGETATSIIKSQGRLRQKQAVKIAMDTCLALEYAHGKGVIHRDIKPENILVDRRGNAIVSDFGIAKVVDQTKLTAAGTFMGTARYVSPEQAMGLEIDGRSDLYSLGITLYEMATGKVPFDSDQWMTVLYQHINEPPPPPEIYHDRIDRSLQTVILKVLEKKPERRFQSAREFHDVLAALYQKMGGEDLSTEAMEKIRTRADFLQEASTEATVLERPIPAQEPPVRKGDAPAESTLSVEKKWAFQKHWWGAAAAVAALALVVSWYAFFRAEESQFRIPDATPPAPTAMGALLVTAFPTGTLQQIKDDDGVSVPVEDTTLPQILQLPPGEYVVVIAYEGKHQRLFALINPDGQARAHAEFAVDEERFLLGDLR